MSKGAALGMSKIIPASFLWVVLQNQVVLCLTVVYFYLLLEAFLSIHKLSYFLKYFCTCVQRQRVCLLYGCFEFLTFIFRRQRKRSQDLKRHHRKLKVEKGILAPSKGKQIIKNISLLLKKEIPSSLSRKKPLLFGSLWTLNGRQRRKKPQN